MHSGGLPDRTGGRGHSPAVSVTATRAAEDLLRRIHRDAVRETGLEL